jgi:hypothetical protein
VGAELNGGVFSPSGQTALIDGPEKMTGFLAVSSADGALPERELERPACPEWVTDDLLDRTREVWSNAYGRPVTEEEAVEMLINVKRLVWATMRAMGFEGGE